MALMKSSNVPTDAIVLDELEAVTYAWDIVSNWEPSADTWALRYGPVVLGGVNGLTGLLINRHYRLKLRLGSVAYFSSVFPITAMPAFLTLLFHRHMVSTEIILMNNEGCPMCHEIRSAAIQFLLGTAYPVVLASASSMMIANRYSTCRLPQLNEGPKVLYRFLKKVTKPFTGALTFMVFGQFVASSVVTYFEMKSNVTMKRKIMDLEAKLIAEGKMDAS